MYDPSGDNEDDDNDDDGDDGDDDGVAEDSAPPKILAGRTVAATATATATGGGGGGYRIRPRACSPGMCSHFPFLIDRILNRMRMIRGGQLGGDDLDDDDGYDGSSLEGYCLVLVLQNTIDSVILNDDPSGDGGGWY